MTKLPTQAHSKSDSETEKSRTFWLRNSENFPTQKLSRHPESQHFRFRNTVNPTDRLTLPQLPHQQLRIARIRNSTTQMSDSESQRVRLKNSESQNSRLRNPESPTQPGRSNQKFKERLFHLTGSKSQNTRIRTHKVRLRNKEVKSSSITTDSIPP